MITITIFIGFRKMDTVPFRSMLRAATGGTEVWTDHYETQKMSQYGWRCTTNEDHYETGTLIGNYNEERFDLKEIKKHKPLPSPVFNILSNLLIHYYIQ